MCRILDFITLGNTIEYMHVENAKGAWIPLVEYSVKKGVSLSTLRRKIKAQTIVFKLEHGRYLIFDDSNHPLGEMKNTIDEPKIALHLHDRVRKLETDLQRAHKEITDLKTLIAFYEEQISRNENK